METQLSRIERSQLPVLWSLNIRISLLDMFVSTYFLVLFLLWMFVRPFRFVPFVHLDLYFIRLVPCVLFTVPFKPVALQFLLPFYFPFLSRLFFSNPSKENVNSMDSKWTKKNGNYVKSWKVLIYSCIRDMHAWKMQCSLHICLSFESISVFCFSLFLIAFKYACHNLLIEN